MGTPQTSGTEPLPAGWADGPQTSSSLSSFMFSPPLHSSSHHSMFTSVTGQLGPSAPLLYFPFRSAVCVECLWSSCLLTKFHVVKLWHFCSLTLDSWLLSLGVIYQDLRVWQVEKFACFLLYGFAQWSTWTPPHIFTYLKQKEQLKKTINKSNLCILTTRFLPFVALALRQVWDFS